MDKKEKAAYDMEYQKTHQKQIKFVLNLTTDADILDHLKTVPNVQGYLKSLIRRDIRTNPMHGNPVTKTGNDYPTGNE